MPKSAVTTRGGSAICAAGDAVGYVDQVARSRRRGVVCPESEVVVEVRVRVVHHQVEQRAPNGGIDAFTTVRWARRNVPHERFVESTEDGLGGFGAMVLSFLERKSRNLDELSQEDVWDAISYAYRQQQGANFVPSGLGRSEGLA